MLNLRMQSQDNRLRPKITVVGVGGAGGNAVNNMVRSGLEGCEFLVCNTDAQALDGSDAPNRIQLGVNVTRGLGAGANPEIGAASAEESIDEILGYLQGSNMVFITAGMGGGTGTGAAPVIAKAARDNGILTVGVVTKPFHFEGAHRMRLAEAGIAEMQKYVDTLIVIPNQNLFRIANEKTTFADAFRMADEVLQSGVRGVTDLMVMPGMINLDFADIRAVMAEMGKAMMGTGEATGERRAIEAAEAAISNPLLDDVSMKGARGVLINITGGYDMTLFEVDEAANRIRDEVDGDANIIFGSTFDEKLQGTMRVSVVATGIDVAEMRKDRPQPNQNLEGQLKQNASIGSGTGMVRRAPAGVATGIAQNTRPTATAPQYGANSFRDVVKPTSAPQQHSAFDFDHESIPASIIPQSSGFGAGAGTRMSFDDGVDAKADMSSEDNMRSEIGQSDVGYAATAHMTMQAAARKIDASDLEIAGLQPRMGQGGVVKERQAVSPAAPQTTAPAPQSNALRGQRHGNTFIPPKPVDPWATQPMSKQADDGGMIAPPATSSYARDEEKAPRPAKKSPSLFERFIGQKSEDVTVERSAEPRLTIETNGNAVKTESAVAEDELDIPAFLRRQAN
jgi:cell division protein FtsZ